MRRKRIFRRSSRSTTEGIRGRVSTAQLEEVSVEERLSWFRQHSAKAHPLWVAEIDDQIAGWFSFYFSIRRAAYRATAEISVYVREKFRRRGVGQTLLAKAIANSASLGLTALIGHIVDHNEPSLRLFDRWGFLPRVARVDEVFDSSRMTHAIRVASPIS